MPPSIRALLQGCLQKNRTRRVADISTARFVIGAASSLAQPPIAVPGPGRRWSIGLAVSTALLAVLSGALLWALVQSEPAAVARYIVTPAEDQQVVQAAGVDIALSPDGSWMVYVGAAPGGGTRLLRRDLDDLDAVAVPGSEGARAPVVSPDGRSIAFVANGAIRTLPVEGGPPFTVVTAGGEPTWSDDGLIYYGRGNVTYRVSAQGGEPIAVTTPAANVVQQTPDALPDGRGLLLTLFQGTPAQARIGVVGPDGGAARDILAGTMARYAAPGHIVYVTANGTLLTAPFDVRRLEVTGPSVPVVEGVAVDNSGTSQFSVSRSGALLYAHWPRIRSRARVGHSCGCRHVRGFHVEGRVRVTGALSGWDAAGYGRPGPGIPGYLDHAARPGPTAPAHVGRRSQRPPDVVARWAIRDVYIRPGFTFVQSVDEAERRQRRDRARARRGVGDRRSFVVSGRRLVRPPNVHQCRRRGRHPGAPEGSGHETGSNCCVALHRDGTGHLAQRPLDGLLVLRVGPERNRRRYRFPTRAIRNGPCPSAVVRSRCGRATAARSSTEAERASWYPCASRPGLNFPSARRRCSFPTRTTCASAPIASTDVTPDGQRFIMVRPVGAGRERRLVLVRHAFGGVEPTAKQ